MNSVLIDGLYLSGVGVLVVFLVLVVLLLAIKVITLFENSVIVDNDHANSQNSKPKLDDFNKLSNIAAAMAVGIYKKEKNNLNDVAAAVAVGLYKKDNLLGSNNIANEVADSSWITVNRSRMFLKRNRRN